MIIRTTYTRINSTPLSIARYYNNSRRWWCSCMHALCFSLCIRVIRTRVHIAYPVYYTERQLDRERCPCIMHFRKVLNTGVLGWTKSFLEFRRWIFVVVLSPYSTHGHTLPVPLLSYSIPPQCASKMLLIQDYSNTIWHKKHKFITKTLAYCSCCSPPTQHIFSQSYLYP